MWTEQDIRTAKTFDEEQKRLLRKIAVMPSRNDEELQKNIVALDNEKFGELMKVVILKRTEILSFVNEIGKIAKMATGEKTLKAKAPK